MSTVRVGVVGAGTIAGFHLAAYSKNPDVTIVAMCDTNTERASERAREFGATAVFSDYREMVASPDIDVVSVCTPNDTHADVAIAALEAGKSVLIEKPMTVSVAQAEAIVRAEAANPGFVQIGYVRRFSSNAVTLKTFIDAGDLGPIYYTKATFLRQAGNPGGWFSDRSIAGGGPLIDLGVHFIDMCLFLMDFPEVQSVSGYTFAGLGNRGNIRGLTRYMTADYDIAQNSVEDLAGALVRFTSGAVLLIDTSYSMHGRDTQFFEIYGEKGGATLEPALHITTELHDTIVELTPTIDSLSFDVDEGFQKEIDTFVRTAQGAGVPVAPAMHGLHMARILAAIYESATLGTEIRLEPLSSATLLN
ncbi:Gfo/Idh/MocA family oxidoreductase [Cryobacterium sp. CG_9.6]|uniref:Gfo/Idh/MocA family protein n=1 Tax=Cryobacterium sp. CG_9.6 TaxID=2760710 RepID=UPI0024753217|nr:Gfo/Idh/MocA family oxidoreductase [Cryobacterium sp. CG_9.6]MDH6237116.1 putative dehydrogenase [Cryobacterium sp. CG_9.6]